MLIRYKIKYIFIFKWQQNEKSFFFLNGKPITPPNGTAIKKIIYFAASLIPLKYTHDGVVDE